MTMPVLVLFTRSLNMDHRKFVTYLGRIALVFFILLCLIGAHIATLSPGVGAAGLRFFTSVVWWSLLFIALTGVFFFSGAITEEKEEMTLGLLKMTGLNPISILMGKGTSRILGGVSLLLAAFPFTLLAITLGGVSLDQVLAAYCTMLSYMLFMGGAALFSSVCCRRTGTAAGLMLFLLFLFYAAPPIGTASVQGMVSVSWITKAGVIDRWLTTFFGWLRDASPHTRMAEIMQTGFAEPPIGFQVLSNIGLGAAFFLLAWAVFDLFTREQIPAGPARGLVFRRTSLLRPLGVGPTWSKALIWKEFHFGTGGKVFFFLRFVFVAGLLGLIAFFWSRSARIEREEFGAMIMVMTISLAYLELLVHAGRTFNGEWRYKTLSDIGLLPMSPATLVYHKMAGSFIGIVPYLVFFVIGAFLAPENFAWGFEAILGSPWGWLAILEGIFLLHLAAYMSLLLRWTGMLAALGIFVVGNWIGLALFAFSFGALIGSVVMMDLVLIFFTVLLHCQIMRLIARRAGE